MELREYRNEDRAAVISLWNDVFQNPTGRNDPARSIDRKIAAKDKLFFVATDDGAIVGTVMAGYDGHRGWLYSVAVDPAFQRRGVGTMLIRHAECVLSDLGCVKINLQVLPENESAVTFYRTLNYSVEPRISMGKIIDDS